MLAMKINTTPYNNSYPINIYNKANVSKTNSTNVKYNSEVNFNGRINKDIFVRLFKQSPIKKLKKFTTEEYLKLTEEEKNILRAKYNKLEETNPQPYKEILFTHNFVSSCIKKGFDKRFGENNYVVIPIGRSLSSIGKSLEGKIGSDNVVNVPLSNAGRYSPYNNLSKEEYKKIYESIKEDEGLNNFLQFLEEHNLSKKDIESSSKHYILMDYCASGNSLKGAEQLFKSDLVWGSKNKNIHAVDIIEYLKKFDEKHLKTYKKEFFPERRSIVDGIEYSLIDSCYKDYATIAKSRDLKDTIKASKEKLNSITTPKSTKLVWFKLLDSAIAEENKSTEKTGWKKLINNLIPTKKEIKIELKKNIKKRETTPPGQKIELWHDKISQYKSDLRNDINEISKILIKNEEGELNSSQKYKEELKILKDTYNKLLDNYETTISCDDSDLKYINQEITYYQIRKSIQELIAKINS